MYYQTIPFVVGVLLLHGSSTVPGLLPMLAGILALFALRWKPVAFLLLGYCWSGLCVQQALQPELDRALEGKTVRIEGRIEEVALRSSGHALRFLFAIERIDAGNGWQSFPGKAQMRWYEPAPALVPGEHWELQARLKQPHGFANPGGFDYERWLFQQGIRVTGYVRANGDNIRTGMTTPGLVARFRHRMAEHFSVSANEPSYALLQALTVGDRAGISTAQWSVLNATGTTHLMAISGLHISLVAGLVFWLVRTGWGYSGVLAEILPAARAAALGAVVAALCYAMLSGFGIPARRALLMISILMLAIFMNRYAGFLQLICLAAALTLLYDPLSILSAGWWLSFWAVLVIAWLSGGQQGRRSHLHRWIFMHVLLALGLLPPLLLLFQQASLVAPVANLLAVPAVGMLVVPLALLGVLVFALHESAGGWLLDLAARLLDWLWPVLERLGQLDYATWAGHRPVWWTVLPGVAGLALLLGPRGVPGRWVGALLLLPMLLVRPDRPAHGGLLVTLLDVGQGLSTVVETAGHVLVYDTGPGFSADFDAGRMVLVPYLRQRGISRVDTLVVSHGDNDHIGGARSLLQAYPAGQVLSSVPDELRQYGAISCQRGMRWEWDAVRFEILHPDADIRDAGNNHSCVLQIETAAGGRVLLSGDIEQETEQELLRERRERLAAQLLVVPHHGSNTSSTPGFIEAVAPQFALIPAGYLNRYRFPKAAVTERYRQAGAILLDTGRKGAISASFSAQQATPSLNAWRQQQVHYWQWRE